MGRRSVEDAEKALFGGREVGMSEVQFIVHDAPALRNESNFISRVDLTPFGFPESFEQVWLREGDGDLFELCCIPFRAYGLALRDVVRVTPDATLVYQVVERSGRNALRILFAEGRGRFENSGGGNIEQICHSLDLLYEWSGNRHLAIDVPSGADISLLTSAAGDEVKNFDAEWEWSDAEEFRVIT